METLILHLLYFGCINLLVLLLGYILVKYRMVFAGWILLIAAILAIYFIFLQRSSYNQDAHYTRYLILRNEGHCCNRKLQE